MLKYCVPSPLVFWRPDLPFWKTTKLSVLVLILLLLNLAGNTWASSATPETETNPKIVLGKKSFEKGFYLKAIKSLEDAIKELETPSAEILFYLGSSYSKLGKFQQAIPILEQALEIQPDYLEAYMEIGMAYQNNNKFEKALSAFEHVLVADPDNGSALFFKGMVLQNLKREDQAIDSFQLAGSKDPEFQQLAQFNVGLLHFQNNRLNEAKAQFEACIQTDPNSKTAESAKGFLETIASQDQGKPWQTEFRAGASIDDNVTLSDINLQTGVEDVLTFYQFSGFYTWSPAESFNLQADYDFFQSIYDTLHAFDMQIHTGSLTLSKEFEKVETNLGYSFSYIKLGGLDFEKTHTLSSGLYFSVMENWLVDLSYALTIKDFFAIPQRDGQNHILRISNYITLGEGEGMIWLSYSPEGEITRDQQFTYVAQNLSLGGEHLIPYLENLETKVRANYQYIYQDFQSITPLIGMERQDIVNQVSFEIVQPILDYFDITFQFQHINSESNLSANDFVEHIYSLSAGATF